MNRVVTVVFLSVAWVLGLLTGWFAAKTWFCPPEPYMSETTNYSGYSSTTDD